MNIYFSCSRRSNRLQVNLMQKKGEKKTEEVKGGKKRDIPAKDLKEVNLIRWETEALDPGLFGFFLALISDYSTI